jgi:hypothetical protein
VLKILVLEGNLPVVVSSDLTNFQGTKQELSPLGLDLCPCKITCGYASVNVIVQVIVHGTFDRR